MRGRIGPVRLTLFLTTFLALTNRSLSQSDDDSSLHFSSTTTSRAVWIIDDTSLPWLGSYEYLSNQRTESTTLLTVVDSSTGVTLGECSTKSHGSKWVRFQWVLASDSMQCTVSPTNSSRIEFSASPGSRSFSVRIQGSRGPACMREMVVQNEKPLGCPPRLSRNSFTSVQLMCGCPYESAGPSVPNEPRFPIFELGVTPTAAAAVASSWAVSPCANHHCGNNGTCVVAEDGRATCFCQPGFAGLQCETDVCANVPCQNGGVCKADGSQATCECPAGFEGILCESPVCNPQCTNGECVVTNGTPHCQCRQGFIGINCNVIDVCLGDAACAMWGDLAKCVLDDSSYIMNSPHLINATFDCRCPHPLNGEYIDCLELHISSSTAAPSPPLVQQTSPSPTFPVVNVSGVPDILPTASSTEAQVESTTVGLEVIPHPGSTFPIQPNPEFIMRPAPHPNVIKTAENVEPQPIIETTTFVFPQTPQTTQFSSQGVVDSFIHQPTHPVLPSVTETEEDHLSKMPFPTPSPMNVEMMPHGSIPTEVINMMPFRVTATAPQPSPSTIISLETTTMEAPTPAPTEGTTTEDTTTDYDEHTTDTESEEPLTSAQTTEVTEMATSEVRTEITLPPVWVEENKETFVETVPTTQSTLPFWMFSTLPTHQPQPSQPQPSQPQPTIPHSPEQPLPPSNVVPTITQDLGPIHPTSEEEPEEPDVDEHDRTITSMESTTSSPDVHQQADRQKSSVASWVVAIVALIVLGLLLLTAALFVLRYIKQSRKLHGKYNPAREEHALSAAYSMPMSHMAKEERLI